MIKVGLLARLVAKPGKEEEVANFLAGALPLAQGEKDTVVWYAIRSRPARPAGVRGVPPAPAPKGWLDPLLIAGNALRYAAHGVAAPTTEVCFDRPFVPALSESYRCAPRARLRPRRSTRAPASSAGRRA
jgi:hypothetical protein